jgi:glutamate-5-semialdehyde dehydrogenase
MQSTHKTEKSDKPFKTSTETKAVLDLAKRAKAASRELARVKHEKRVATLLTMANKIEQAASKILDANRVDLASMEKEKAPDSDVLKKRLALDETKIIEITRSIREVAKMADPIGQHLMTRELDENLILTKIACPIGLVAIIFESRPDALPQIVSLCLKSGNAAILKGGTEAQNTNEKLFECIQSALEENQISTATFALTHKREDVSALLSANGVVDLIIPRGSNALVSHIMQNTQIPVLGHAAGICHVFVDEHADIQKALNICVDAKVSYPAACNAAETILIHRSIAPKVVPQLLRQLADQKVEMRCDNKVKESADENTRSVIVDATEEDYGQEFSNLTVAIKIVNDLDAAIEHINTYSSNHTDTIITEDDSSAQKFFEQVDSAGVYHNASTRFADGFRYGFGAEVGISNGKMHPRGPVGLDGLTTYKYKLKGDGHIAADYSGANARPFTHKDLETGEGKI